MADGIIKRSTTDRSRVKRCATRFSCVSFRLEMAISCYRHLCRLFVASFLCLAAVGQVLAQQSDLSVPDNECTDTITLGQPAKVCRDQDGVFRILPLRTSDQMTFDDLKSDLASLTDDTPENRVKANNLLQLSEQFRQTLNHRPYDTVNTIVALDDLERIMKAHASVPIALPKKFDISPQYREALKTIPVLPPISNGPVIAQPKSDLQSPFTQPEALHQNAEVEPRNSGATQSDADAIWPSIFLVIFCIATRYLVLNLYARRRLSKQGLGNYILNCFGI